jgi:hypothetical protein
VGDYPIVAANPVRNQRPCPSLPLCSWRGGDGHCSQRCGHGGAKVPFPRLMGKLRSSSLDRRILDFQNVERKGKMKQVFMALLTSGFLVAGLGATEAATITSGLITLEASPYSSFLDATSVVQQFNCAPNASSLCLGVEFDGLPVEYGIIGVAAFPGAQSVVSHIAGFVEGHSTSPSSGAGQAGISGSALVTGSLSGPCNSAIPGVCYETHTIVSWSSSVAFDPLFFPQFEGILNFKDQPTNPYTGGTTILLSQHPSGSFQITNYGSSLSLQMALTGCSLI